MINGERKLKMRKVFSPYRIERISGDPRYVQMLSDFGFYSGILDRFCKISAGFIHDEESVPLLKGTNPEAGLIHDYFSRYDSDPVVDKKTAALIYQEFQKYYDDQEIRKRLHRFWDWIRRGTKIGVVGVAGVFGVVPYFHKHSVLATYKELKDG